MKRLILIKRDHWIFTLAQTLFSLVIAVVHILRENFKVIVAACRRFALRGHWVALKSLEWSTAHKLALVFYGLLSVIGLKFIAVAGLIPDVLSSAFFTQFLDITLLLMFGVFFYMFRAVVFSFVRLEQIKDTALLSDGVDFNTLLSLHLAIESSPEAFALWDKNQKMVLSNSKFKNIYKLQDLKAGHELNYHQFGAQVNRLMMRPRRLSKNFKTQSYQAQLCNGRWLNIQERPTSDGGQLCVSFDVTNLKTVQQNLLIREKQMCSSVEELRHSRRELEQKTQKLAELADKLRVEKERAEEANQVKSEFLANISHELRTPLNAILGFSDMMQREVLGPVGNEKYQTYVNDIHMSGAYLLELINDILDMSRIEAGRLKLECRSCLVNKLLTECVNLVSPQAMARDIEIIKTIDDDLFCDIDQRAIKQVILNLMSNAIKFTPEGGTVELIAARENDHVHLKVKDTGIGIEPSQIGLLCKPFAQVENQMTKTHPGTGLGLAISRSLVDLHGGALTIESEVGVGTTVFVRLPITAPLKDKTKPRLASMAA